MMGHSQLLPMLQQSTCSMQRQELEFGILEPGLKLLSCLWSINHCNRVLCMKSLLQLYKLLQLHKVTMIEAHLLDVLLSHKSSSDL